MRMKMRMRMRMRRRMEHARFRPIRQANRASIDLGQKNLTEILFDSGHFSLFFCKLTPKAPFRIPPSTPPLRRPSFDTHPGLPRRAPRGVSGGPEGWGPGVVGADGKSPNGWGWSWWGTEGVGDGGVNAPKGGGRERWGPNQKKVGTRSVGVQRGGSGPGGGRFGWVLFWVPKFRVFFFSFPDFFENLCHFFQLFR